MNKRTKKDLVIVSMLLFLTNSMPAYAYLDPGSVSIFVTSVLGAIAAVGYMIRLYWYKIIGFLTGRKDETVQTITSHEEAVVSDMKED